MSTQKVKTGQLATRDSFNNGRLRQSTYAPQSNFALQQQGQSSSNGIQLNESNNNTFTHNGSLSRQSSGIRERGVVEKILTSYGFVQCTERKARFFFHFSEYKGNINALKIGDEVEFQESVDKRTGKPVAVSILKLNDATQPDVVVGAQQVEGSVLAEARIARNSGSGGDFLSTTTEDTGRVTYEQAGEVFFLPFSHEDMEPGHRVSVGDKVTFFIAPDRVSGNMRARRLRKKSLPGDLYQGVVCSMKDNYGFIERADVVREIFFHFSEFDGDAEELALGDDVEYGIQSRNGKDVAVSIRKLPPGTVIFEDMGKEWKRGKIKKTLKMAAMKKQNDALVGRIVYETLNGPIEIAFGEKDPVGDYMMFPNDIVEFCIATDRRDKVQHAANIRLVDDTFTVTKEKREKGFVTTLKEGFGFIRCTDREARMFFHFSELLNVDHKLSLQDELEFTIIQDPTNPSRQVAVRLKLLPPGTILVQPTHQLEKHVGVVQKEAGNLRSIQGSKDTDPGIIMYEVEGTKQTIPYSSSVVDGNLPKFEEKVEFQISECQKNKTKVAINVRVVGRAPGREREKERGFVVTLKENYGFIEVADHEREIYFHYSNYDGDLELVDVGTEVEFQVVNKGGRNSAENIRRIPSKSIPIGEVNPTILEGRIVRGLHVSDSPDYFGLVQLTSDPDQTVALAAAVSTTATADQANNVAPPSPLPAEGNTVYPFSIMSLVDRRETQLAKGDWVKFQLVEVIMTGAGGMSNGKMELNRSDSMISDGVVKKKWAYRLAPNRKFEKARIESINDIGGTLNYEMDIGQKLSFSFSDAQDPTELSVGDEVEFVISSLNSRKVAVNLRKASDRPRPERLISRIKSVSDDQSPRVVIVRPPRGPDGSRGFKCSRRQPAADGTGAHDSSVKLNGGKVGSIDGVRGDVASACSGVEFKADLNDVFAQQEVDRHEEGSVH